MTTPIAFRLFERTFVVSDGADNFSTLSRNEAITHAVKRARATMATVHGGTLPVPREVAFDLDARLPWEKIALVCPCCGACDGEGAVPVEIECWAVDGESSTADRAECPACTFEGHSGLFETEKTP